MDIFKSIIVVVALLIIFVSMQNKKVPKGIIEWAFIISGFVILISNLIK